MEDKRTAYAILLIILVVMFYSEAFVAPYTRPQTVVTQPGATQGGATQGGATQGATTQATSQAAQSGAPAAGSQSVSTNNPQASSAPAAANQISAANNQAAGHPSPAELKAAPSFVVSNSLISVTLNQLGGRIESFKLKRYQDHLGTDIPLDLVAHNENTPLPLGVYVGDETDERVIYNLEAPATQTNSNEFSIAANQDLTIKLRGKLPSGANIEKELTFHDDSYLFDVNVKLSQGASSGTKLWLGWSYYLPNLTAQDRINPERFTYLNDAGKIEHVVPDKIGEGFSDALAAHWTSLDNKYFTAVIVPQVKDAKIETGREGSLLLTRAQGGDTGGSFTIFAGPKDLNVLRAAGHELDRSVDLGFFSFLAQPLLVLMKIFFSWFGNYGLAIVLLTLVIKTAFFPLTRASLSSMKSMQAIQPEMKALRERIKDANQLNQEMLALYKKHGVNPMGGCLPMIIQIPVFFGLFSALQNAIELRHAHFALWVNDLSSPERLVIAGINFPVMILLMGATMLIQQYITPTPGADPSQRKTMFAVSIVFTLSFIIFPFPAGLALYMLVNTTISILQQQQLKRESGSPFVGTLLASLAIFVVAFILTRVPYKL